MLFFTTQGADDTGKTKEARGRKSRGREIAEWVVSIAVAVALAIFIRMFVFEFIRVEGPSMETTLFENEYMFVTKADYILGGPERCDVIVCHYPGSTLEFVKRVIGLPGDVLMVQDGELYINDVMLEEPYLHETMLRDYGPYTVPEGSYFVMGDNRNISMDSRDPHVGALERGMILGHVRAVVWPLKDMKWVPKAPESAY